MKNYRVIALYVQGLRKRPYEAGEIVTEENFYEGVAEYLESKGYIREISEDDKKSVLIASPEGTQVTMRPVKEKKPDSENKGKDLNFTRTTRTEMMKDLDEAQIKFDPNESKASLYEKWKNLR